MNRKQTAIALAAILIITGGGQNALAAKFEAAGGTANNDNSIAIGTSSKAGGTDTGASVAIGVSAEATGSRGIAIGTSAKATYVQGIAIGENAETTSSLGLAIGASAKAHYSAIALGTKAVASEYYSLAFGIESSASVKNSVALGSYAVADRAGYQGGYDPLTKTILTGYSLTPTWESSYGAVSVGSGSGSSEKTRQIIHVAAGSEDTDAVNVAQLKASQTTLTLASGESTLTLTESKTASGTSYALSLDTSALQSSGVAAGTGVSVSKSGSTYTVSLNSNQTFGTVTATNFKSGSTVTLNSSGLTLTSGPSVTTSGISAGSKTITNVLAGTSDTDAVNVAQLKASKASLALKSGESNLEISSSSSSDGTAYTLGIKDEVSFSKVTASDSMTIGSSLTLSGSNIQVGSAVALSSTGLAITGGPTVTTTGINAGSKKITEVANGESDTDAVNVSQLKQTVKDNKSSVVAGSNTSISSATATDGGTQYTVSLDEAITLTSVTTGNSTLTSSGLTITGGPSVTTSGISAGSKTITNVLAGTSDTDAVNVAQLKASKTSLALESGESNLVLSSSSSADGTAYTLKIKDEVSFSKVTATNTMTIGSSLTLSETNIQVGSAVALSSTGLAITSGPSVTTTGINAGSKKITQVANGESDTDAVNVSQLKQTVKDNKSSVVAGSNTSVSSATATDGGTQYTVSLDDAISLTSVTTGSSTLTSSGLTIADGPSVTSSGISAGSKKITQVAKGESDTDAVNVGQLNETVKNNKSSVAAGSGIQVSQAEDTENGGTKYTVSLNSAISFDSVTTGSSTLTSSGLTITGGPSVTTSGISAGSKTITNVLAGTENTDAVNVAQLKASKASLALESGESNLDLSSSSSADGTSYTLKIKDEVSFSKVTASDSMTIGSSLKLSGSNIQVGSDVSLSSTGLAITGGPTVTTSGINAGSKKITQVAKGESDTDAVNVGQLNETVKNNKSSVAAGSGLQVSQAEDTVNGGTKYTVSLNNAISLTSVTTGNSSLTSNGLAITGGPSVTTTGIDAAEKKITQVADGESDSDAVNLKQLKSSKSDLSLEGTSTNLTLSSNTDENGTHYTLGLTNSVSLDQVTTTSLVIGTSGVNLTNQGLTLGTSGPYFTTSGISAGGQKITNVLAGVADTDAVNVGQLNESKSSLALASGTTNLTLNSTTDANGTHYELGLNGTLEFDRVTAGNTVISSDGFSITGGPSMSGTGINASNKTISNVAAGTEATDAVNKGQMEAYVEQKKTTITQGSGISVAETTNSNGGTNYEISLDSDISFDSVSTGDTKITDNGVSIDNGPSMTKTGINAAGTKVTQVADGESDADAVNVSQLNKAKSRVKAKENGNLKVTSTSSENGTEYEVSLEDSVAVSEVQVGENVRLSSEGIRVGERGPAMTESGFDAGGNVISNVAAGVRSTDAVNLGQMNSAVSNIYRQIHSVDKDARAGIAMAIATAGLPQAYLPGKSMFAISGGTYRGQSGYAIGFSHVTDKGRVVIKATGSGNSQGHFGGSVGVGWQW